MLEDRRVKGSHEVMQRALQAAKTARGLGDQTEGLLLRNEPHRAGVQKPRERMLLPLAGFSPGAQRAWLWET